MNEIDWSEWRPFAEATADAPRVPGVYMLRQRSNPAVVYVGSAGERQGQGLRGRLRVYSTGKGLVSGLGEATFDRALADPEWVRARLREIEDGSPRRAKEWGQLAIERADLEVRWTLAPDKKSAEAIEDRVIAQHEDLWNRRRTVMFKFKDDED